MEAEMGKELQELLARARNVQMTAEQSEEQRRSFAYGTANIENEDITRETVRAAALSLQQQMTAARG